MDNYIGKRWGDLTEEEQDKLLFIGNVWDNVKEGECIVDFTEELSIGGRVVKEFADEWGTLVIDDNAVFYNPQG